MVKEKLVIVIEFAHSLLGYIIPSLRAARLRVWDYISVKLTA